MIVDLALVYAFIKRLITPFENWEAFKLGIIDKDGNVLKKRRDLLLMKERRAFGVFDVLVQNIKKMLAKVPGGNTRLANYAAALWLVKEHAYGTEKCTLNEDTSDEVLLATLKEFWEYYHPSALTKSLVETNPKKLKSYKQILAEVTAAH